jgi:2-succinyl-5-enolpyruvyl-6-hydroxy-3-cyclohexene-1-carboxylate synthase
MFSCVDERSAAYMACGIAAESGEPVVITCTGATASRNYIPGLTEAYYRKLPIVAITGVHNFSRIGHLEPQVIDRSVSPNDTICHKIQLPAIRNKKDLAVAELKINTALLELHRNGGQPVHIDLQSGGTNFSVRELPNVRMINRVMPKDKFPDIPNKAKKIAIYVCAHARWTKQLTESVNNFCKHNDAIVFCDHTSGYKGQYRVMYALVAGQEFYSSQLCPPDLLIHIGELSGDYFTYRRLMGAKEVWRVSPDGEIRDTFYKLRYIFEMDEEDFFNNYSNTSNSASIKKDEYLNACKAEHSRFHNKIPELPFSNLWIAKQVAPRIPEKSVLHFGVSNTMRSWTFFDVPNSVTTNANVGCRGIDGALSSLIGASLVNQNTLNFGVLGDLTFFYDINSLGNRHIGNNLRILLVNNGRGTEFRLHIHKGQILLGNDTDNFVAAAGHFGNKSLTLVKNYATALGFEYLSASNKGEFSSVIERFLAPELTDKPMLFEVFTDSQDESNALKILINLETSKGQMSKQIIKNIVGKPSINVAKKFLPK